MSTWGISMLEKKKIVFLRRSRAAAPGCSWTHPRARPSQIRETSV